ncbi:MAG: hypothetical protein WBQ76_16255 [Candidatus Korobacteraceae bacterium]
MGVVAACYAIFATPPLSRGEKLAWTAGIFFLFALEIFVIFKERAKQDREHEEQIRRIEETRTVQLKSIEELRTASESRTTAMMRLALSVNDPINSLKARALRLSEQILDFVYRRMENRPQSSSTPYGTMPLSSLMFSGGTAEGRGGYLAVNDSLRDIQRSTAYTAETNEIYQRRFSNQVRDICGEMMQNEIRTELREWLTNVRGLVPTNLEDMRSIAEGIGQVAGELTTQAQATDV